MKRCGWAKNDLAIQYHDTEWGVPTRDDRKLFEFLILEGAQAGLSWDTVLRKRENYREAFDNFDAGLIALYNAEKIASLLQNEGIIRNRLKIASAIQNAQSYLKILDEFGSFGVTSFDMTVNTGRVTSRTRSGSRRAISAGNRCSQTMTNAISDSTNVATEAMKTSSHTPTDALRSSNASPAITEATAMYVGFLTCR